MILFFLSCRVCSWFDIIGSCFSIITDANGITARSWLIRFFLFSCGYSSMVTTAEESIASGCGRLSHFNIPGQRRSSLAFECKRRRHSRHQTYHYMFQIIGSPVNLWIRSFGTCIESVNPFVGAVLETIRLFVTIQEFINPLIYFISVNEFLSDNSLICAFIYLYGTILETIYLFIWVNSKNWLFVYLRQFLNLWRWLFESLWNW